MFFLGIKYFVNSEEPPKMVSVAPLCGFSPFFLALARQNNGFSCILKWPSSLLFLHLIYVGNFLNDIIMRLLAKTFSRGIYMYLYIYIYISRAFSSVSVKPTSWGRMGGGVIQGPTRHHSAVMFGGCFIARLLLELPPMMPRDWSVSGTAVRLIGVVFPSILLYFLPVWNTGRNKSPNSFHLVTVVLLNWHILLSGSSAAILVEIHAAMG